MRTTEEIVRQVKLVLLDGKEKFPPGEETAILEALVSCVSMFLSGVLAIERKLDDRESWELARTLHLGVCRELSRIGYGPESDQ